MFLLRFLLLSLPNNVWRLIVFAPFLIIIFIIIKSPKQSLGDLLFLLRFLLQCIIIKSPKQSLGDLFFLLRFFLLFLLLLSLPNNVWETCCFCSVSYYCYYYSSLSPFFLRTMNLSMADLRNYWTKFHETWWSYRYMFLVGPKVFSFVVKGVKVIF